MWHAQVKNGLKKNLIDNSRFKTRQEQTRFSGDIGTRIEIKGYYNNSRVENVNNKNKTDFSVRVLKF